MKEEKQMSKNIADLYNEVMSSQAATAEKTASAQNDVAFDASFFEKVASGDEEAVGALNAFIDEARSEGHSDEEIEAAIGEAMNDAGIDLGEDAGDDDFEMAKSAAYAEGVEEAFAHVMGSDFAKTAGVTEQDLMEYELGLAKGQGYAETRAALEAVVEKIAGAKIDWIKSMAGKGKDAVVAGGKRYGQLMAGGAKGFEPGATTASRAGNRNLVRSLMGKGLEGDRAEALKSLGARAGTAAVAGGAAYGGKKMYDRKKKR
jgi:hypothetical protein